MNNIVEVLNNIDSVMYYPVLIIVMAVAGLYFTLRTKGVQIRLFGEALNVIREEPDDKNHVSSLQAMLVSTASRVGTGNIVGVSTAICLGGAGAVFWMWVMCIIATSSAFVESTLAQIYKRKSKDRILHRESAPCAVAFRRLLRVPDCDVCGRIQHARFLQSPVDIRGVLVL